MKRDLQLALVLASMILISGVNADFWGSSIGTNSTYWSIYRQSVNISFNLSSSVEGTISPVDFRGRSIQPYYSNYADLGANDVRLRERTYAKEGKYKSEEETKLLSAIGNEILIDMVKPSGTDVYTINYREAWPVLLTSNKTMRYSGQGINDRDFGGNNLDFIGSNLLYNPELAKERRALLWLRSMNATVIATDNAILSADFKPTKYLGYLIRTHTTGIADFRFRQTSASYDPKRRTYPPIGEGAERYYGNFNIGRLIEMRSTFENVTYNETWLPCEYCGWADMHPDDRKKLEVDCIFNCSCPY
ncbi:MAG: hypothetical protein LUQ22_07505 [Methanotrichaceae archaeon]|nr:hypothetical protein [Methanotrichaceae archaeon]